MSVTMFQASTEPGDGASLKDATVLLVGKLMSAEVDMVYMDD